MHDCLVSLSMMLSKCNLVHSVLVQDASPKTSKTKKYQGRSDTVTMNVTQHFLVVKMLSVLNSLPRGRFWVSVVGVGVCFAGFFWWFLLPQPGW